MNKTPPTLEWTCFAVLVPCSAACKLFKKTVRDDRPKNTLGLCSFSRQCLEWALAAGRLLALGRGTAVRR